MVTLMAACIQETQPPLLVSELMQKGSFYPTPLLLSFFFFFLFFVFLTVYKYDVIHNKKEKLTQKERMKMAHDIAQAMVFLHGSGVVHRDLKSKV